MSKRVRAFIKFAEANNLGRNAEMFGQGSYQAAVDLGRQVDWWRNCAVHLFEMRERELSLLEDREVEACEACDEHHNRCGDA